MVSLFHVATMGTTPPSQGTRELMYLSWPVYNSIIWSDFLEPLSNEVAKFSLVQALYMMFWAYYMFSNIPSFEVEWGVHSRNKGLGGQPINKRIYYGTNELFGFLLYWAGAGLLSNCMVTTNQIQRIICCLFYHILFKKRLRGLQ